MVNRDLLRARALRAYEAGRLRSAARIALLLVPLCALCLMESRSRQSCACAALLLIGWAVWLRWRDRQGLESVSSGLQAGSLPLLAGLVFDQLGLRCSLESSSSFCALFALLIGAAAAAYVSLREQSWPGRWQGWLAASAIATLAASLGCLRLGVLGLASMGGGIALGAATAAFSAARRA